ncbi:hypothetical protein ABEF95_010927 [Exophiala dermatitidis]
MTNVFEKHRDKLAGVWALTSWEMYDSEGPEGKLVSRPHGDNPLGKVVISQSGYLSAILVTPSCLTPPLPSDDWSQASDEAVLRIGRNLTTYAGPMEVHERDNNSGELLWHTTVEIAHNPNWIGKPQTRLAKYSEEDGVLYMTLRPVKPYVHKDGTKTWGVLRWKKVRTVDDDDDDVPGILPAGDG